MGHITQRQLQEQQRQHRRRWLEDQGYDAHELQTEYTGETLEPDAEETP